MACCKFDMFRHIYINIIFRRAVDRDTERSTHLGRVKLVSTVDFLERSKACVQNHPTGREDQMVLNPDRRFYVTEQKERQWCEN